MWASSKWADGENKGEADTINRKLWKEKGPGPSGKNSSLQGHVSSKIFPCNLSELCPIHLVLIRRQEVEHKSI